MAVYTGAMLPAGETPKWEAGLEYTMVSKVTWATGLVTGDTFVFPTMLPPAGCQIKGGAVWGDEMDTNAAPTATLIVGDGTDTDGYLASKVAGNAPGTLLFKFDGALLGSTAAASQTITATLGGTVATASTAGSLWCEVTYYCDRTVG